MMFQLSRKGLKGLKPDETGNVELSLNAMKRDALREYVKRRKQA